MRIIRTASILGLALALGIGAGPVLNSCSSDASFDQVLAAVGFDPYRLSDDGHRQLDRFRTVFTKYARDPENTRQLKHFTDAFKRVQAAYVERMPESKLIDAAIAGVEAKSPAPHSLPASELVELALDAMTAALDPHSAYLNAEELRESEMVTTGEFGGLGIQVTQEEGVLKVIAPLEGTPADRAGMRSGDLITHLNGDTVKGMSLKDAVNAMRGEPGTSIRLTIQRSEQPAFDVSLTRAIITIEPVRWRVETDIGYLRIVSFNEKVAERVDVSLRELQDSQKQAQRAGLKGLVIDLRNNPGGLLDQSLTVADAFLDEGVIVSIRGRDGTGSRAFTANTGDLAKGLPIVVLINGGSASASEIVASALRDHQRATVMGTESFGKGSVQTVMRLPVEGALKLTTALYYAPSGETIQARGVSPDIRITGVGGDQEAHEVDLPGALPGAAGSFRPAATTVDVSACPPIGPQEDRELGCAVAFLRAGSTTQFLASIGLSDKL
ncbi:MAG: S41 family peptidase [Rhodospirillales bacterium]|nr:S41 family peptidase [Rhodospirillales bacterium]